MQPTDVVTTKASDANVAAFAHIFICSLEVVLYAAFCCVNHCCVLTK